MKSLIFSLFVLTSAVSGAQEVGFIFSCSVSSYIGNHGTYVYVNSKEPIKKIHSDDGVTVEFLRTDANHMWIHVIEEGQTIKTAILMDASRTEQLSMSVSNVNLSCLAKKESL